MDRGLNPASVFEFGSIYFVEPSINLLDLRALLIGLISS
jgi:hypothetical protein